jgi:hypothetical protein
LACNPRNRDREFKDRTTALMISTVSDFVKGR